MKRPHEPSQRMWPLVGSALGVGSEPADSARTEGAWPQKAATAVDSAERTTEAVRGSEEVRTALNCHAGYRRILREHARACDSA
jgi:hypothetical protein